MAKRDQSPIYDGNHHIFINSKNGFNETRNLHINIIDFNEYLQLKLKDPNDFLFNYTVNIDNHLFESIRNEQYLDIDFCEFKSNLIDLLQQTHKQQMYLKCEIDGDCCKLIFYNKSKIKSLIYLVIDLKITNQKDIFDEMNHNYLELQKFNKHLQQQIQSTKQQLNDKIVEIKQFEQSNHDLARQFINNLQEINGRFSNKLQDFSRMILEKIYKLTQQLLKLIRNLEIIKHENIIKTDTNCRLLHTIEGLRFEQTEARNLVSELKKDNSNLKNLQASNEMIIIDLKRQIGEFEHRFNQLKKEKDEIEKDVKQATLIIAQKTASNEELAKDLVQANQMLVNFNHLHETKNKEIEDLQANCNNKERLLQDLINDFDEYKMKFNLNEHNRLREELLYANKRIDEIEKSNREYLKLNELLTRKLSAGNSIQPHFRS